MDMEMSLVSRDISSVRIVSPVYWGLVLSVLAGGISIVQAFYYFRSNDDKRWLRSLAAAIFISDLVSIAMTTAATHEYFVRNFGNLAPLRKPNQQLATECIFTFMITFLVQFFFAYQINQVKPPGIKGKLIIGTLATFAGLGFIFMFFCSVVMYSTTWKHYHVSIIIGFTGARGFATLFDIVSTVSMCLYLKQASSHSYKGTKRLLNELMVFFMNRGALVTTAQGVLLVVKLTFGQEMIWLTPHLVVTRLYVNTFFAMLNARTNRKRGMEGVHSLTTSGSSGTAPFNSHSINPSFPSSGFRKDAPTVSVTVDVTDDSGSMDQEKKANRRDFD